MDERVNITDYGDAGDDDVSVNDWEAGLPSDDDLTPLSHTLISPELASAFSITQVPCRSLDDVNRASMETLSSIRLGQSQSQDLYSSSNGFDFGSKCFAGEKTAEESAVMEVEDVYLNSSRDGGSDPRRLRKTGCGGVEEADSRTSKRPRLVWTPQLHRRFIDVVDHLGVDKAVPKMIMQLMNVEGLTRENVASHLQKYRLYLKRVRSFSTEGPCPSSSDRQSLNVSVGSDLNGHGPVRVHPGFPSAQIVPLGMFGMAGNHSKIGIMSINNNPYNNMVQQRDWSGHNPS